MSCKKINELFKEKKKDFFFINKFNKNLNTDSSISLYSQTEGNAFENRNTVDLIDLEHPGTKSEIEKNNEFLLKNSKNISNLNYNEEKRQKFLAPIGYACLESGNLKIKNIKNLDEKKVYNFSENTQRNISEEDLLKSGLLTDILHKHSEIIGCEALSNLKEDKNIFEIKTKCIELCKDQEGSRFVQEKITEWNERKTTLFLKIISEYFFELSTSVFGNYVIQKIFSKLTFDQLLLIHERINKSFLALSLNMFGCRVIQVYLETILNYKTEFKIEYEQELNKNTGDKDTQSLEKTNKKIHQSKNKKQSLSYVISIILDTSLKNFEELIVSPFANHVIQKCFDLDTKNILLKELLKNPCKYANEKYGCRIIQKLLYDADENIQKNMFNNSTLNDTTNSNITNSNIYNNNNNIYNNQNIRTAGSEVAILIASSGSISEKLKLISELKFELLNNATLLISDQYGNYVIQLLICDDAFKDLLLDYIIEHCRELSICKFSSNIIEKYVAAADQSIIDRFFDSFNVKIEGKEFLLEMMKDGCANYVIQTLYLKASEKQKRIIQKVIKENYTELQNISYFKSMYNKMINGKNK